MNRRNRVKAFTLIEMIVVMAVSAVLLTIIAYPLIQS
ncbi:MAG: type II secretion system protein, partial [Armatimonadota bacterium]